MKRAAPFGAAPAAIGDAGLLLGDDSLDLVGQLGEPGVNGGKRLFLTLAVELDQLPGVGNGDVIALLGEVDLLGRLLLDGGGGEHVTAVLGDVLHRRANHVALALGDRLDRLDRRGADRGESRKVFAAGLDDALDVQHRELELAGDLAEVEVGEGIFERAIGEGHGKLLTGGWDGIRWKLNASRDVPRFAAMHNDRRECMYALQQVKGTFVQRTKSLYFR